MNNDGSLMEKDISTKRLTLNTNEFLCVEHSNKLTFSFMLKPFFLLVIILAIQMYFVWLYLVIVHKVNNPIESYKLYRNLNAI